MDRTEWKEVIGKALSRANKAANDSEGVPGLRDKFQRASTCRALLFFIYDSL